MKRTLTILSMMCCLLLMVFQSQAQTPDQMTDFLGLISDNNMSRNGGGGGIVVDPPGDDGGGSNNFGILINWAFDGVMVNKTTVLKWHMFEEGNGSFKVVVAEEDSDNVIFSAVVNGNMMKIPLSMLDLQEDTEYYAQVSHLADAPNNWDSNQAVFSIVGYDVYKVALKTAKSDPKFARQREVNQLLMKAFALEHNRLYYEASKLYNTFREVDQEDMLLRNMRDVFRAKEEVQISGF